MTPIAAVRTNVAARIVPGDATVRPDLLSSAGSHDNLVLVLDAMTAPPAKGGLGYRLYVSALHRDHHDDGDLGPHGHNPHGGPSWACDVAEVNGVAVDDNHETRQFIRDLLACAKVTKVGTTAAVATRADLQAVAAAHGKLLFVDEGTGHHVHFQSAEGL